MNRKQFIKTGLIGGVAFSFPFYNHAKYKLNILILGGTNFVGPAIVRKLLRQGHNVTLFNRGKTDPNLFPDLELILGNRYPNRDKGLSGLQNKRKWDAVIDTWAMEPGCVNLTARLLKGRVDQYLYISSLAAYQNYRKPGMTESSPLINADDYIDSFDDELSYPIRKRASEQAVENSFGNRGVILRCSSILGFDAGKKDPNNQESASYWGFRFLTNEPVLAPDDPTAVIQFIDVKDVANYSLLSIQNKLSGAFNLVGPEEPILLMDFLEAWKSASYSKSEIVWVDPTLLQKYDVRPFLDLPFWIPLNDPEPGFFQFSNKRALNSGLTFQSMHDTLSDIVPILNKSDLSTYTIGLSRTKEIEILEKLGKYASSK